MSGSQHRGESSYHHDRDQDHGGRPGGSVGKRALTAGLSSSDAASKLLGQIKEARSTVKWARTIAARMRSGEPDSSHRGAASLRGGGIDAGEGDPWLMDAMGLPGMPGVVPNSLRGGPAAGSVSADLKTALAHLGTLLDEARDAARVLDSGGGLEIVNELALERAALLADAEPLRADQGEPAMGAVAMDGGEKRDEAGAPKADRVDALRGRDVASDLC